MSDNNIVYQKETDYSQKVMSGSTFKYTKLLPQQGAGDITVQAASSTEQTFDIPVQVFNLSNSTIDFSLLFAAAGGGLFVGVHCGIPPIRRISLYTRGGMYLCDIQNFQHYWKMTKNLIVKTEEFASYPNHGIQNTAAGSKLTGLTLFNNSSNSLYSFVPVGYTAHGGKISDGLAMDNASVRRSYQSEMSYQTSTANAIIALNCQLRLGKIPFSIFNVNRNLYFNEALVLKIEIEQHTNFAFVHDTAVGTLQNVVAVPTAVTMSGLSMYLAVEENEAIRQSIMSKVMSSGLNLTIPYSQLFRFDLGAGTSASVNQKINRSNGSRLLRIISSESLTADTTVARCNFDNLNGAKVTDYYTTVNSVRQEAENLLSQQGIDYKYNAKYLKGSPLEVQTEYYTEAPVHINDFSGCGSLTEAPEKDLHLAGLDLTSEVLWGKVYNAKAAVAHTSNIIVVGQKTLISAAQGIMVN